MRRLSRPLVLAAALLAGSAPGPAAAPRDTHASRTRLLLDWAREAIERPAIEDRQRAVRMLEEVLRREPGNVEAWLARGRAHELGAFDREARGCYARVTRLAPGEPEGHLRLAMAWRHEWLRRLDPAALDSAIVSFERVLALRPNAFEPRLRLVPLRYEAGDAAGAMRVAERAAEVRPQRGEPALAMAYLAYRRGEIERADSLFRWALDRIPAELRARLEDLRPVLGEAAAVRLDSLTASDREVATRRMWAGLDPDPTTSANELQLELWSRAAHAGLLFDDPSRKGEDARVEAYMRYGPPQSALVDPQGVPLFNRFRNPALAIAEERGSTLSPVDFAPMDYPVGVMSLPYPELGMRIVLQDRSLQGHYEWPTDRYGDYAADATPDRRLLAGRDDLLALGDGFAVFPTRPPAERRLEVWGAQARFEAERGPRLFAQVGTPAAPGEALTAVWVVRDTSGRERVRQEQRLATSVCDPSGRRIAELSAPLPPGTYDVAVSVRDTHHKRGLHRVRVELDAPRAGLALSDVVLTCGEPLLLVEGRSIRLEADVSARVSGREALVAYFEIYRLATGEGGRSSFEYEYSVRKLVEGEDGTRRPARGRAVLASTTASRVEVQSGAMRRQFVTVPTQDLEPGRYQLGILVRDLANGNEARRQVEFTKT